MGNTYAIADLHGRYDLLLAAIDAIEADAGGGTVVFMGDYVDRGPQSREIIDRLMAGPERPGWRWICLKGNHEAMMVETLSTALHPQWWIGNGGGATLLSYGHPERGLVDKRVVPKEHVEWIDRLPLMHVDQHRVFVHAGVVEGVPLDKQDEDKVMWMLYPRAADCGHGERHVVHGHEQFADGPKLYAHRTDLDTFAWATGRLVVGVFDDEEPGGPVRMIEVKRDPDARAVAAGWLSEEAAE